MFQDTMEEDITKTNEQIKIQLRVLSELSNGLDDYALRIPEYLDLMEMHFASIAERLRRIETIITSSTYRIAKKTEDKKEKEKKTSERQDRQETSG